MPYHKNKQQAFQAAEQGVAEAKNFYYEVVKDDADYGRQLKHLQNEVNEALEQIENALEVASERQKDQLMQFQQDILNIASQIENS